MADRPLTDRSIARPRAPHPRWHIVAALAVMTVCLAASYHFANKAWRTYQVLETARTLDMPKAADIRAWMTLEFVAATHKTPLDALLDELALPPDTPPTQTLRTLAENEGVDPLALVQRIQSALAAAKAPPPDAPPDAPTPTAPGGWFGGLSDEILGAVLVYGYPVLAVVLFLGALGLPVPSGPLLAVVGALALQGEVNAASACILAVAASVSGDLAGYAIGRYLGGNALERWGRWIGYTKANKRRLDALYARWGGLTLILTRSLVAYISAIASLLAGTQRYSLKLFLAFSLVGRALWSGAYFGIGYLVGSDFDAASGFLGYLSLLLISGAIAAGSGTMAWRRFRIPPA